MGSVPKLACQSIISRSQYNFFFIEPRTISRLTYSFAVTMITHDTLYSLANTLGALAMCTVVVYHFIAVNAKYVTRSSTA
ncbi:hypothetical protein F5888DRAFT_1698320 [Russula emetica]|nr:hypothetical protein F5888DRAFT_1698320 [Russula emetica]